MAKKSTSNRKARGGGSTDYIKWCLIVGGVAAIALLGYLLADRYNLLHRTVNIDMEKYPVRGIDVSKHNGEIDFKAVAAAGYKFVFIKATEGATYRDASFERNYRAAREAGLKVGAYHFFRKNRGGGAQARNLLNAVSKCKLDLPLVIDLEDWGNDHFVSAKEVIASLSEMVDTLRVAHGYHVAIYTNGDGYRKYYKDRFEDYDLWLCSFTRPDSLTSYHHTFQQYSHWATVDGIEGDVDLNVFCGSQREWESRLKQWAASLRK